MAPLLELPAIEVVEEAGAGAGLAAGDAWIGRMVGVMLGSLPLGLGALVARFASQWLKAGIAAVAPSIDQPQWAIGRIGWAFQVGFDSLHGMTADALGAVTDLAWQAYVYGVPYAIRTAEAYAWAQGQWAAGYAYKVWEWARWDDAQVLAKANSYAYRVYQWASWALGAAEAYAWAQGQWAAGYAYKVWQWADWAHADALARASALAAAAQAAAIAAAENYAYRVYQWADWKITTTSAADRAHADAAAQAAQLGAVAAVDQAVIGAATADWPTIARQLNQLSDAIGDGFPDVRSLLAQIPAAVPASAAGVLAALPLLAAPAMQATIDCTIPMCEDLGAVRSLFHDLRGAGFAAALLAWLIYCVQHPQEAADDTAAVGVPLFQATAGTAAAAFGVQV